MRVPFAFVLHPNPLLSETQMWEVLCSFVAAKPTEAIQRVMTRSRTRAVTGQQGGGSNQGGSSNQGNAAGGTGSKRGAAAPTQGRGAPNKSGATGAQQGKLQQRLQPHLLLCNELEQLENDPRMANLHPESAKWRMMQLFGGCV